MSKYVVVDLEICNVKKTSGSQYKYGKEIIQIGAVLLDKTYQVVSSFETFVKPRVWTVELFYSKSNRNHG